jgi:hypothetical protein
VRRKRRNQRIWIVVGTTIGLASGVYAADKAATPTSDGDELARTITAQKINDGELVTRRPPSEHQREAYTPDQILLLADQYGKEMKVDGERVEGLRMLAYKSRDLIRMTCIDNKLTQIMVVIKLAEPRIGDLPRVQDDPLVLQERFTLVRQARERVGELATEAELCMGDNLTAVTTGRTGDEVPVDTDNVFDPTRPPAPGVDVERPPEASPYR